MQDLDAFAARFAAAAIPVREWTHAAHLAIGAWHVARFGADEALGRLRAGIRRLNESNGVANTATAGYHETITRAYVHLLADFLAGCPPEMPLAARVDGLLSGPLGARDALFAFYTRETLLSPRARAEWVEPDLEPLPLSLALTSR